MSNRVMSAKIAVAAVDIENAAIERFKAAGWDTFGLDLKATREGFESWITAVESLGFVVDLNRPPKTIQSSKSEPVYGYELTIFVPEDWQV